MATPRSETVEEGAIGTYHVFTRCAQQEFLIGHDLARGLDFSHRKDWLEKLLKYLASVFAVDVGNYTLMSNHHHLLARTRPDVAASWTDQNVAWRWSRAFGRWTGEHWGREVDDARVAGILASPERVARARWGLQSLSWFMARLNESISRQANSESGKGGHFWAERFQCRRLDDEAAVLTCSAYIDLNQPRAGVCQDVWQARYSAAQWRWLQGQAAASLEKFHRQPLGDHALSATEAVALLDCPWLSPICEETRGLPLDYRMPPVGPPGARCGAMPPRKLPRSAPAEAHGPRAAEGAGATAGADEIVGAAGTGATAGTREASPPRRARGRRRRAAVPGLALNPLAARELAAELAEDGGEQVAAAARGEADSGEPGQGELGALPPPDGFQDPSEVGPTFEIHGFELSRLKPRASDTAILAMPLDAYRRIVEHLAARSSQAEGRFSDGQAQLLAEKGIRPEQWPEAVAEFTTRFGRIVAGIKRLEVALAKLGVQWIRGIQACRDHFT